MLCGGVLALLARQGAAVHFLCATRGEGGEAGEPPLCSIAELGQVREGELVCAVQALGGRSLTFLGYTDPRVGSDEKLFPYTDDLTLLTGQVAASLRQFSIDVLLTHGSNGEYGHPAHILSHQAARLAVASLGEAAPSLYTVCAAFQGFPRPRLANRDDPAHLVLEVDPVLEQKTAAAQCHRTQHGLFIRRSSQDAGRLLSIPEVIMRVESLHRAVPPVAGQPDDPLFELLAPFSRLA